MQFAITLDDNKRTKALPNIKAICPGCLEPVIPKCGEINIHHFAHQTNSECHLYKPETEWHRAWKDIFPEECREVRVTNANGKTRIADVLFAKRVYEFQTVLPSPEEIRERELFWTNEGYLFGWIFMKPEKFLTRRVGEKDYRGFHFSKKFDSCISHFVFDDPEFNRVLRIDSFERYKDSLVVQIKGEYGNRYDIYAIIQ